MIYFIQFIYLLKNGWLYLLKDRHGNKKKKKKKGFFSSIFYKHQNLSLPHETQVSASLELARLLNLSNIRACFLIHVPTF